MRRPALSRFTVALAAGAAVVVAGGLAVTLSRGSHPAAANAAAPVPVPSVHISHVRHHQHVVTYSAPLRVGVGEAVLRDVRVVTASGAAVPGSMNSARTTWTSTAALVPDTAMTATVSYADRADKDTTIVRSLRTTTSPQTLTAVMSPGDGDTVGVGSPVVVTFNYPVPTSLRAAVERRMSVTSTPNVVGAWHWMSDETVHWRPPTYWASGTRVTVAYDFTGLRLSRTLWGASGQHKTGFRIGDSHISEVDVAGHEMRVYDNGKLIRTFPISAGRAEFPTMGGVHIALDKEPVVQMDSATVGIDKGNPNYYNETVYWDVRISNGGAFVHAAPWSVADQGRINVSHGCVNLSPADAEWFFHYSLRGDVVDVYDTVRPPSATDPGTADWNMSWKQWVHGDPTVPAAVRDLHPPLAHDTEPGFAPRHKHHHHSH